MSTTAWEGQKGLSVYLCRDLHQGTCSDCASHVTVCYRFLPGTLLWHAEGKHVLSGTVLWSFLLSSCLGLLEILHGWINQRRWRGDCEVEFGSGLWFSLLWRGSPTEECLARSSSPSWCKHTRGLPTNPALWGGTVFQWRSVVAQFDHEQMYLFWVCEGRPLLSSSSSFLSSSWQELQKQLECGQGAFLCSDRVFWSYLKTYLQ